MFAIKASRLAVQAQKVAPQTRSVVSGPPTVKISPAEKLVHGLIITGSCMAIPAWVLVNIKHYRQPQS
ncbi:hypothetical protein GWI33_022077 [Rhynchophorus ferrugineus]|uniref:Uncharacterized protein n=1 Tax=Rhynchophorus ferrugineus TaxID=354439 RepID=A0A834IV56_RHYFE|nr:hypothetical protein GWI33_022077 [Rhynchophorus ferrugineus]